MEMYSQICDKGVNDWWERYCNRDEGRVSEYHLGAKMALFNMKLVAEQH